MAKEKISFENFLQAAGQTHAPFIHEMHALMADCTCDIKQAKSGYVVSYAKEGALLNYVFRKKGPLIRLYAQHVPEYMEILQTWPQAMKENIKKATSCKKLLGQTCSPTCKGGYDFILDGQRQQKCRSTCFLIALSEESNPYLKQLLQQELAART